MQFTFAIPRCLRLRRRRCSRDLSVRTPAPSRYTQPSFYSLDLGGLSVTASADSSGKTRWDLFTVSSGLIQQGDLAWFNNDQPNGNEVFTAAVGSQPNLFTFQRKGAQPIGVDGTTLLASNSAATVSTSSTYVPPSTHPADTVYLVQGLLRWPATHSPAVTTSLPTGALSKFTDGTNGVGQCITFEACQLRGAAPAVRGGEPRSELWHLLCLKERP
ncbi:hypothetical protein B0H14DRAFT_2605278 [Mycena olivaceomarginata]|nr:hypothetical protein B0H14DRAFT_2605278 [Mycena olivaceomarginata]